MGNRAIAPELHPGSRRRRYPSRYSISSVKGNTYGRLRPIGTTPDRRARLVVLNRAENKAGEVFEATTIYRFGIATDGREQTR
jgi:hypothetical protein